MAIDRIDTSDSKLPDALQFISEQLVEDADYLERTFPANAPRNWRRAFAVAVAQESEPARVTPRKATVQDERRAARVFRSVAAAAAVAIVLTGFYAIDARDSAPGSGGNAATNRGRMEGQPTDRIIPAGVLPSIESLLRMDSARRPRFATPMAAEEFNTMLSGPEQEAIIDVMIEHEIPEPNVRY